MSDIFISYSRRDREFARELHAQLTVDKNYDVWMDWEDIPPAERWRDEIRLGIQNTDALAVIVSHQSLTSRACQLELRYARLLNKKIIPVLIEKVSGQELERYWAETSWGGGAKNNWEYLKTLNWIPPVEPDAPLNLDMVNITACVADAVSTDRVHLRSHTRYYLLSKEWQQAREKPEFLLRGVALEEAEMWLAQAASKTPPLLPEHLHYIQQSRIYTDYLHDLEIQREQTLKRRQRITRQFMAASAILLLATVVLTFIYIAARIALDELEIRRTVAVARQQHASGQGYYGEGNFDGAYTEFNRALDTVKGTAPERDLNQLPQDMLRREGFDFVELLTDLGTTCARLDPPDYECASSHLNEAIRYDAGAVDAYLNLAIIERDRQVAAGSSPLDFSISRQSLENARKLTGQEDWENQMQIARIENSILYYEGEYEQCLRGMDSILNSGFLNFSPVFSSYEVDIYYYIALSHEALGQHDEMCNAWKNYQEVMIVKPPRRRILGDTLREASAIQHIRQSGCTEIAQ